MPARHCACSARARSAHVVTSARSALPRCPLGTAPPRSEVVQDEPTYGSLTGKKNRGEGHVGVEPHAHVMRKDVQHATPCEKTCKNHAKSCHAKSCHAKSRHAKTMQKTSCSTCHAKTMQKPCKMRRVRSANPPNIHSPRVPCYMCYMCYISQGKPLNIHSPRVLCYMYYMCYMCYISQGKPLNIHSPRVLCYMYYMCYMALYSTYSTDFARTEHIAHIVHIARSRGRVEVRRLGV